MTYNVVMTIRVILSLVIGFTGAFVLLSLSPDTYEGKEIFQTQAEYLEFVESLTSSTIDIINLDVAAESPLVIASFKVNVLDKEIFPYGKQTTGAMAWILILGLMLTFLAFVFLGFIPQLNV